MNRIITIGRQYGSGGTEIGRMLAEQLGVSFYDKELLRQYAIENGLGKLLLESFGDKHAASLLFSLSTSAFSFGYYDAAQDSAISQKAYLTAFDTVKEVAKKGPCVIVGRCADYVLRNKADCLNIFIHAPQSVRIATVADRCGIGEAEAEKQIQQQDRMRRCYYNYYTRKNWGEVDSYHVTIDSSVLGVGLTAGLIRKSIPYYFEQAREQNDTVQNCADAVQARRFDVRQARSYGIC